MNSKIMKYLFDKLEKNDNESYWEEFNFKFENRKIVGKIEVKFEDVTGETK